MSIRAAGTAFLRQERQRHLDAIARIDATMADLGIPARGRRRVVKAALNGKRLVKAAAKQRRRPRKPVARAANLAAAATGN